MATATLTSKGQITVPVKVRRALGVDTGDRVEFIEVAPGRFEFIAANHAVSSLKGIVGPAKRTVSIEEMNQVVSQLGSGRR